MKTKMMFPVQERLWFILLSCLFWVLVLPIPFTVYLIIKRLERKQLCRLLIGKVHNINYYIEELSVLRGVEPQMFRIDIDVTELSFQNLSKRQEELRREYDLIVFQHILDEKIHRSRQEETQNAQSGRPVHEILKEVVLGQAVKEVDAEKESFENVNKVRLKEEQPLEPVKDNKIVIDPNDSVDYEF